MNATKFAPHNLALIGFCSALAFKSHLYREQAECQSLIFNITHRGFTYPFHRKPCDVENTSLGWGAVCMEMSYRKLDSEAMIACNHMIELDRCNPDAYLMRAALYENSGRPSLAKIDTQTSAQLSSSNAQQLQCDYASTPITLWILGN